MIILNFRLCPALKSVFEHGLKRSSLLGGPGHPWLFLEEVSHVYKIVDVTGNGSDYVG